MEKFMILLICVFVAIQAQEHHFCRAPEFFQGKVLSHDHVEEYYRYAHMSYDGSGRRVRLIETFNKDATRPQYDELILHNEKKRYLVDLKTRKCNITTINFPFHPIEVPPDSHFNGEATIGVVGTEIGSGLRIVSYSHEVRDTEQKIAGHATYTFSREDCIPISEVFHGESTDPEHKHVYDYHRSYYDITLGLDDLNIFMVPPECHERRSDKIIF